MTFQYQKKMAPWERRRVPCVITNIVSNDLINLATIRVLWFTMMCNGRRGAHAKRLTSFRFALLSMLSSRNRICCHEHTAQPKWGAGAASASASSIRLIRFREAALALAESCNTCWAWSMSWSHNPIPLLPLAIIRPTSWSRNARLFAANWEFLAGVD